MNNVFVRVLPGSSKNLDDPVRLVVGSADNPKTTYFKLELPRRRLQRALAGAKETIHSTMLGELVQ